MPLAEDVIKSLIDERIHERDIEPWAIRKWSDKNLTAYIPSISVHHTGDKQKDRRRGHFIIRSAIRWAISLDKHYDIKKWYAIAATPEGKKLVEHLGFEKIAGKRDAYLLTDLKKAERSIRTFVDALENEETPLVTAPKADSKSDSKTGGKQRTTVDTSRQNGTERKTPIRSTSRSTEV